MATAAETRDALYDSIKVTTDQVMTASYNPAQRAVALQSLALAFRYLYGGAQPGSTVVEK